MTTKLSALVKKNIQDLSWEYQSAGR